MTSLSRSKIFTIVISGLVVWFVAAFYGLAPFGDFPAPQNEWQAVFLQNNQVYFGKLANYNRDYVALSDVYYLRAADELQGQVGQGLNLVKLGGELHGPENIMYIPKDTVLFWEDLKPTSRVVEIIRSSETEE